MKQLVLITLSAIIIAVACNPKEQIAKYNVDNLLSNVGDNIIMPNYKSLKDKVLILDDNLKKLKSSPNETTLSNAQESFISAYKAWQLTTSFIYTEPAEHVGLASLNSFPTNTTRINNNISNGNFDLESGSNTTAIGFPALDYLLFDGNTQELIQKISENNYSQYLTSVSEQLYDRINQVYTAWTDTHLATFISAKSTDAGSSIGILANSMIQDFEAGGREAKIGIPTGVRTLNEPIPTNVEAYYSGVSIALAKNQINGLKTLFTSAKGGNFKQILIEVEKENIANDIIAQLDNITKALDKLSDPFSSSLASNDTNAALAAYNEYQKLLPLLKVDMTAALGLLITYKDSDGD